MSSIVPNIMLPRPLGPLPPLQCKKDNNIFNRERFQIGYLHSPVQFESLLVLIALATLYLPFSVWDCSSVTSPKPTEKAKFVLDIECGIFLAGNCWIFSVWQGDSSWYRCQRNCSRGWLTCLGCGYLFVWDGKSCSEWSLFKKILVSSLKVHIVCM